MEGVPRLRVGKVMRLTALSAGKGSPTEVGILTGREGKGDQDRVG